MGDFNMTRFMDEHQDYEGNIVDSESFNDLIRDIGLIDIPLRRRSFTWSNKRASPLYDPEKERGNCCKDFLESDEKITTRLFLPVTREGGC